MIKMEFKVTFFPRINWTNIGLRTITVQEAIDIIRNGTFQIYDKENGVYMTLRGITDYIQHLTAGTDLQPIKLQYLPAVSFNGVYDNGIVQYSNVTALDFDHISTQNLLSDAEVTICKYKWLIINVNAFVLG